MPPPTPLLSPITFGLDTPPARPELLSFLLRRVPAETAWVSVGRDRGTWHCCRWLWVTGLPGTLSSAGLPSLHTPAIPVLRPLHCLGSLRSRLGTGAGVCMFCCFQLPVSPWGARQPILQALYLPNIPRHFQFSKESIKYPGTKNGFFYIFLIKEQY